MAKTRITSGFRNKSKVFRGGDGGELAPNYNAIGAALDRMGARRFSYRNSAVLLSGAERIDCIATRDLFDRAHSEQSGDRDPKLLPAAEQSRSGVITSRIPNATPRMYHKSEFHEPAAGVLIHQEQVFDDTAERKRRLEGVFGNETAPTVLERATRILGANLRNHTRPRTRA